MDKERFDAARLEYRLQGRAMDWRVRFFPTVDSTNRLALRLAREGAPEGTIVIADEQTRGRGRLQRVWQSPPDRNLYASLVLRPAVEPASASLITLTAGVAAAEAIAGLCPRGVGLKWPNDVLVGGRKVCGILTEIKTAGRAVDAVVVGIGLNVNMAAEEFAPEHRASATSLREETGRWISREEAAFRLCDSWERWYGIFLAKGFAPVRVQWLAYSAMAGARVKVRFQGEVREGAVAGIDHDGALLLEDEAGAVLKVIAGDATIVKE